MPRQQRSHEAEKALIHEWGGLHSILGQMLTKEEKLDTVQRWLNKKSAEEYWGFEFTTEQIANKIDALQTKAKKTYDKFKKLTSSGQQWKTSMI